MTTVGGRLVGLVWMFASIIVISGFTAAIASSITVNNLAADLMSSRALSELRVGAIEGSTGQQFARSQRVAAFSYTTLDDALAALESEEIDAILYDRPILKHISMTRPELKIEVKPDVLVSEEYSIALPPDSPLREDVNVAVLKATKTEAWREILFKHLGE